MKLLACPKCHQQLHLENKTLKCENNHCYDISKRGYIFSSKISSTRLLAL